MVVVDSDAMPAGCSNFFSLKSVAYGTYATIDPILNHYIDTSNVTNMSNIFNYTFCNTEVAHWDTSSATNMSGTFKNVDFNPDITNWNNSKVGDISSTFAFAKNANPNVINWDTTHVVNMKSIFEKSIINLDFLKWNVSNVTGCLICSTHRSSQYQVSQSEKII